MVVPSSTVLFHHWWVRAQDSDEFSTESMRNRYISGIIQQKEERRKVIRKLMRNRRSIREPCGCEKMGKLEKGWETENTMYSMLEPLRVQLPILMIDVLIFFGDSDRNRMDITRIANFDTVGIFSPAMAPSLLWITGIIWCIVNYKFRYDEGIDGSNLEILCFSLGHNEQTRIFLYFMKDQFYNGWVFFGPMF